MEFSASPHDDSEDKNLSWLYNFKLNELPHLSPEVNRGRSEIGAQLDKIIEEATAPDVDDPTTNCVNETSTVENVQKL